MLPQLQQAAPKGIDVYFDNVGGEHLDAAFAIARQNARFAICGMIDDYNSGSTHAFRYIMRIIAMRIMVKGFIYTDYLAEMPEFYRDMGGWLAAGTVKSRETVHEGIEAMPDAFLDLFSGGNTGQDAGEAPGLAQRFRALPDPAKVIDEPPIFRLAVVADAEQEAGWTVTQASAPSSSLCALPRREAMVTALPNNDRAAVAPRATTRGGRSKASSC